MFVEECRISDHVVDHAKSSLSMLRNVDAYMELSHNFRLTGLVAFQKRVRKLLTNITRPTAGILAAWETVFTKWSSLSSQLALAEFSETLDERTLVEWRNYSGLLASLGAACIAAQDSSVDESLVVGLRWIDRFLPDGEEETLLGRYMQKSMQLLSCPNARVSEATREVLSNELCPALYPQLFAALQSELGDLFNGDRASSSNLVDTGIIFAEQAAALLRSVVEKLDNSTGTASTLSIDLGALVLDFARYLDGANGFGSGLRVKTKLCQLCELITCKKELLNLRHDVRIRNALLEILFGWIARPGTPRVDNGGAGTRMDEGVRLQLDLDKACLKALAQLVSWHYLVISRSDP